MKVKMKSENEKEDKDEKRQQNKQLIFWPSAKHKWRYTDSAAPNTEKQATLAYAAVVS